MLQINFREIFMTGPFERVKYSTWSAVFIALLTGGNVATAGPAEDLAARRVKLESMQYGLSAWSYDSGSSSFANQINDYNNINTNNTVANRAAISSGIYGVRLNRITR